MITLREEIDWSINNHQRYIDNLEAARAQLPASVLAIEVPGGAAVAMHTGELDIHAYHTLQPDGGRQTLLRLMDLTGQTSVSKKPALPRNGIQIATVPVGDITIHVWYRPNNGCRKARVTEEKVIEVCGSLDESQYLSVEYLEEG